MASPVLYSTNPFFKLLVQERFRKDQHYVWCSSSFDGAKLAGYTGGAQTAPSSNPRDIYQQLKLDCQKSDQHSAKIQSFRTLMLSLASQWHSAGDITSDQRDDIIYLTDHAPFEQWRPLVYVIPRDLVDARLQSVPAAKCASFGPEFIIPDLDRSEFDIIEF